ncbi:MAG: hypothetical protein J0H82_27165 [Alphaproteobacteria bacterium]|jgi:hypothetical protein|nr:hypothetical protein [Alphaproteobacteria bacterium]
MEPASLLLIGGRRWAFGASWYNGDSDTSKGSLRDQAVSMVGALRPQGANALCLRRDGINQYAIASLPPGKLARPSLLRPLQAGAAALAAILPPDTLGCWPLSGGRYLGLAVNDGMVVPSTDIVLGNETTAISWLLDEIRTFGAGLGDRAELFLPPGWLAGADPGGAGERGGTQGGLALGGVAVGGGEAAIDAIADAALREVCRRLVGERGTRGLAKLALREATPVDALLSGQPGVAPLEAPGRLGNLGPALRHPAIAGGAILSVCAIAGIVVLNDKMFRTPPPQIAPPVQAAIRLKPAWTTAPAAADFLRSCRSVLGGLVTAPPPGWSLSAFGCEPPGGAYAIYRIDRQPSEGDLRALRMAMQPRAIEFLDNTLRVARTWEPLPGPGPRADEEPLDRRILFERLLRLRLHSIEVAIGDGGRGPRAAALPGATAAPAAIEASAVAVTMTGPLSLRHWPDLVAIPGLVLNSVRVDLAAPDDGDPETGLLVTVRGEAYARS